MSTENLATYLRIKRESQDLEEMLKEYRRLLTFYEDCKMAYYAPPMDLPPAIKGDRKIVCRDLKRALDKYDRTE